jgi:hypothetical protein
MRPFPEAYPWILTLWAAGLCSCFQPFEVECGVDDHCNRFPGGLCHQNSATGNQWCKYPDTGCPSGYRYSDLDVGDGVSATCVAVVEAPSRPIVENGQRADLVLGQEIFTTRDENHGGLSARSLRRPSGVAVDEADRLWILDSGNHRALMWSPAPPTSFAAASLVVGSSSFTSTATDGNSCLGSTIVCAQGQLAAMGGKLLIPAKWYRVSIWNPVPTINGSEASIVLGQASFNENVGGYGAEGLKNVSGVWTDGTRVAVADTSSSRVLIWTSFPTTNKQPADLVLGQPGFSTSICQGGPVGGSVGASTMCHPQSVYSDGVMLFVADTNNNRVLVWRSFPTVNGQPADFVIGQPDLTSNGEGHGASQLRHPSGVTTVGDHLFVADTWNSRVLEFSPIPTASGASASRVLGRPNFDTNSAGTAQDTLAGPSSLAVGGSKLYVTDTGNHRVLRFDLKL